MKPVERHLERCHFHSNEMCQNLHFQLPPLLALSRSGGAHRWEGGPRGLPVLSALLIEQGRKCLVLLDPEADRRRPLENLVCIGRDGSVAWLAELPEGNDTFVRFHLNAKELWASTGTGRRVRIDLATGRALEVK